MIIVGVIGGAAAIGGGIYHKIKNREAKEVSEFRSALKTYLDAIRKGSLDTNAIEDLMSSLEALKQRKDYEKITIELSTEELDVLVNRIYEYTQKLAMDNNIELTEAECTDTNNTILNLQNYLKAQKRIFEAAA